MVTSIESPTFPGDALLAGLTVVLGPNEVAAQQAAAARTLAKGKLTVLLVDHRGDSTTFLAPPWSWTRQRGTSISPLSASLPDLPMLVERDQATPGAA
jgi:hypothetical protein